MVEGNLKKMDDVALHRWFTMLSMMSSS